jgi:hypothetical protein
VARTLLLLGLVGLAGAGTRAEEPAARLEPFAVRDMNPFVLAYGLPAFEAAELAPAGHARLQLLLDYANNSKRAEAGGESITIDGETYRVAVAVRRGITEWLEVGVEVPFVLHGSGVLDAFIQHWHGFWGMPNEDRADVPNNVLDYSYRDQGQEQAAVRDGVQGLGDIRLSAAATVYRPADGAHEVSLHASLKLPTGDPLRLLGSGSTDAALSVSATERTWSASGITGYGRLGLLVLGDGEVLADRQRRTVIFGGLGLGWRASSWLDLKAQADVHGPFFQSALLQLDATSVQVTFGGAIQFGAATTLDLAVGENIFTDTTPDFLVQVALTHRL